MTIGKRIKLRRIELGLSADELAERIQKNRATVYRYEGDEIANLTLDVVSSLAKALQCSEAYIMGWDEKSSLPDDDNALNTLFLERFQKLTLENRFAVLEYLEQRSRDQGGK